MVISEAFDNFSRVQEYYFHTHFSEQRRFAMMVFVYVCCCWDYFNFFLCRASDGRGTRAYNLATTAGERLCGDD